jgi:hypothetical protein
MQPANLQTLAIIELLRLHGVSQNIRLQSVLVQRPDMIFGGKLYLCSARISPALVHLNSLLIVLHIAVHNSAGFLQGPHQNDDA